MIIIYGNAELWTSFPAEQARKALAEQDAFNVRYKETGELLGAYGNADAVRARTVRVRDGVSAVTDGPYLETKEYLASWYLVDVEDEQRALDLAAEIPFASVGAVEVWPILHEAAGNAL
ncbi:YciI family protein [Spirillospora sp. NPDC047279]|uniref:YciI family protein n=1 Tax=Spirillospora sp. NPDC047279 TaxID=3155478 RepID=UPI0033E547D7